MLAGAAKSVLRGRAVSVISSRLRPSDRTLPFSQHVVRLSASTATAVSGGATSVWEDVPTAPMDKILGLNVLFKADPSPTKVNLGIGAYRTDDNEPYVLPVVRRMEQEIAADAAENHEYCPQDGLSSFCDLAAGLILGKDSPAIAENRVVTVQALSGTGALHVGFSFIRMFMSDQKKVYLPKPTWSNHYNVVTQSGLPKAVDYRYFDPKTGGVDIDGMVEDLREAPEGSVVLLHCSAHNPTGADPTPADWQRVLEVVQERRLLPFFDSAYQGFASGSLEKDAYSVRLFVDAGIDVIAGMSFAKNMGLYGQRIGALNVICADSKPVEAIRSQLKGIIRAMYSNPPVHGAKVAAKVMGDPAAFAEWEKELVIMSERIMKMRGMLRAELEKLGAPGNWEYVTTQIGMFTFTHLSPEHVKFIREKHSVYMTDNGRISMAGLTEKNVAYVAEAMRDALVSV